MKIVAALFLVISIVGMASAKYGPSTDFHLLDVLQYTCINIFPRMEDFNHISDHFGLFRKALQPGCDFILEEADAPDGFNETKFCNFLVDFWGLRELVLPTVDDFIPHYLSEVQRMIFGNMIKRVYGIDIGDPSTICPNAHRFFKPSLLEILQEQKIEYYTEMFGIVFMPIIESICQDMRGYFASLGVQDDDLLQLASSLLEIAADIMGFESFENQCQEMRLQNFFDKDWSTRRMPLKKFLIPVIKQSGSSGFLQTVADNIVELLQLKRRSERFEL